MELPKKSRKNTMLWLIAIIFLIILLILILWLKPNTQPNKNEKKSVQLQQQISPFTPVQQSSSETISFSSKSQQDTQINCQIHTDASNHLIVNEQTKDCFEYFITQFGEKNLEQIKKDFLGYINTTYKDPLRSQLGNLWTRYINYRNKLGDLQAPTSDKDSIQYYQQIINNTKYLRKQFFSDYEIQGLFGTQDIYDQYTLDRIKIMDDKNLSSTEKAKKLKDLFDGLPEDWKENLQQLNQLEDLRKLTADIKARGGSAEELRQMRNQLVGAEATQRLEVLDTQRGEWKQRVNQYLSERESIMQSSMSDSAKQSAIAQLRSQKFANQHEQLRLNTFEAIHDQGGKLPFSD